MSFRRTLRRTPNATSSVAPSVAVAGNAPLPAPSRPPSQCVAPSQSHCDGDKHPKGVAVAGPPQPSRLLAFARTAGTRARQLAVTRVPVSCRVGERTAVHA